jgi:hypothetical protein
MFRSAISDVSTVSSGVANGRQTLHPVPCSFSKIPYGGFSPVRLQTGIGQQPSFTMNLYAAKVFVSEGSYLVRRRPPKRPIGTPLVLLGRSSPEALGSPAGYIVPPGHGLLWPHPSLWPPPAGLLFFVRRGCFGSPRRTRGSPIYSACLSLRAVFRTPVDPAIAADCYFTADTDLHPIRTGSVSTSRAFRFQRGGVTRLQSSLNATARRLVSPARPGRLLSSFHLPSRLEEASNMTTRASSQFPRPDFHRQDKQHYGLQTNGPSAAKPQPKIQFSRRDAKGMRTQRI